jgi:hypothetical protein
MEKPLTGKNPDKCRQKISIPGEAEIISGALSRVRTSMALIFAGLTAMTVCRDANDTEQQAVISQEMPATNIESLDWRKLADDLEKYSSGMDEDNRGRFEKVLNLMRSNLTGIEIEQSDFPGREFVLAQATIEAKYYKAKKNKLSINKKWNANNGFDMALLVHELLHIVDNIDGRNTLGPVNYEKIWGASGTKYEIRTELRAWELMLVLADKLSGGLFEQFYQELSKIGPGDTDGSGEARLKQKYTDAVYLALNVRDNKIKDKITAWLHYYFSYRSYERFDLDCKWSYNFVSLIGKEYLDHGIELYELELPPESEGKYRHNCVYPLPQNGSYSAYRPYLKRENGYIGPSKEKVEFLR